ncbi:hypothetical protein NHQ30_000486 [Ciborinia camelliae]|nr:hypothetical protein NHQ30_000486 [Ciborinia camelliae]
MATSLTCTSDVVATCFQLAYTRRSFSSSNLTSTIWPWVLMAQLIQTISITTSCIPYLRPLLKEYPSGMFLVEETRRGTEATLPAQNPNQIYILRDRQQSVQSTDEARANRRKQKDYGYLDLESRVVGDGPAFEAAAQPSEMGNEHENIMWDSSSQKSQSRIIKAVTTIQTSWSDARRK